MKGRHNPARLVGADRDEAEVKGASMDPDVGESRAVREFVLGGVIIHTVRQLIDCSIACISKTEVSMRLFLTVDGIAWQTIPSEPYFLSTTFYTP